MSHNDDMIKLMKLVESTNFTFAGESEQKPGDQVRGTDKATNRGTEHPFKDRLVGEEATLEDKLAKKYQDFKELQAKEKENKEAEKLDEEDEGTTAEQLNIGDEVIVTGAVKFSGSTGVIRDFGRDKRFVVVDLYNHGPHSFHSSDVEENLYAGSEEEAERIGGSAAEDEIEEGKWFRTAYGWAGGSKPGGGKYKHPESRKKSKTELCPSCSSADVKTYSDGEKECNHCHKTWDVRDVSEAAGGLAGVKLYNSIVRILKATPNLKFSSKESEAGSFKAWYDRVGKVDITALLKQLKSLDPSVSFNKATSDEPWSIRGQDFRLEGPDQNYREDSGLFLEVYRSGAAGGLRRAGSDEPVTEEWEGTTGWHWISPDHVVRSSKLPYNWKTRLIPPNLGEGYVGYVNDLGEILAYMKTLDQKEKGKPWAGVSEGLKLPRYIYGKVTPAYKAAKEWLKIHGNNGYDYFDYPEYAGMPKQIANKLSTDEVDFIQQNWAYAKGDSEGSENREQELRDYIRAKERVLAGGNALSPGERRALAQARRELKSLKKTGISEDVDVDAIHAEALREHLLTNPKLYENQQDVTEIRDFLKLHSTPIPRVGEEYMYVSAHVIPFANFINIARFNRTHQLVKLQENKAYFEINGNIKRFPISGTLSGDALSKIYFFSSEKEFQEFNTLLLLKFSNYKKTYKILDSQDVSEAERFSEPLSGYRIVYRKSGYPVTNTPGFKTREEAQRYLMTKMFANHQDYQVTEFSDSLAEAQNATMSEFIVYVYQNLKQDFSDLSEVEDLFDYAYLTDVSIDEIITAMEEENKPALQIIKPRLVWLLRNINDKQYLKSIKPLASTWMKTIAPQLDEYIKSYLDEETDKKSPLGRFQRGRELSRKVAGTWSAAAQAEKAGDQETADKMFRRHVKYANLEHPGTWKKVSDQDVSEGSDSESGAVEAYGVAGMKSRPWRRVFASQTAFDRWLEKNKGNVEVHGMRAADPGARVGAVEGVAESIEHNVDDLSDVADWMRTTPDKLKIVVKQEPIEKFMKQIREMYGTYDEFPEDEERTNRILKLLKKGSKPLPMYVEDGDPDLFVMEGRHRMVAFWLAGMKTIPVAYVSVKEQGVAEGYWKDALAAAKKSHAERAGKPFELNPQSHDERGVYLGDRDLAGNPVPKEPKVKEAFSSPPPFADMIKTGFPELKAGDRIRTRKMNMTGTVERVEPYKAWSSEAVYFRTEDGKLMRTPLSNVVKVSESKLSEGSDYVGRQTADGIWRIFQTGNPVAVAGPFRSQDEVRAWFRDQKMKRGGAEIEAMSDAELEQAIADIEAQDFDTISDELKQRHDDLSSEWRSRYRIPKDYYSTSEIGKQGR